MAFSAKIKGSHHLQGNVQVYNIKIPVGGRTSRGEQLTAAGGDSGRSPSGSPGPGKRFLRETEGRGATAKASHFSEGYSF